MKVYGKFDDAIAYCRHRICDTGYPVKTEKWQGVELKNMMRETLNVSFSCVMPKDLSILVEQVKPNLPWADTHFEERMGKIPLNPGESYKQWPFYGQDEKMRNANQQFTHSYMERIWPKFAGYRSDEQYKEINDYSWLEREFGQTCHRGIRYEYGDMEDLKVLLVKEPYTRQAYLPIWHPEDTGSKHGGRVPCTLGYHFIRRDNYLHIVYYIRSCDYLRHFRDDIYLAVRKVYWLLNELQHINKSWDGVKPGLFTMHITSLHIFDRELEMVKKYQK